jgi:hypothetical protein
MQQNNWKGILKREKLKNKRKGGLSTFFYAIFIKTKENIVFFYGFLNFIIFIIVNNPSLWVYWFMNTNF